MSNKIYDSLSEQIYEDYIVDRLRYELNQIKANLRWLVDHSVAAGSISKAKGAELLGIPLIDYVNENFQENGDE